MMTRMPPPSMERILIMEGQDRLLTRAARYQRY
jgi:hypothetical protein